MSTTNHRQSSSSLTQPSRRLISMLGGVGLKITLTALFLCSLGGFALAQTDATEQADSPHIMPSRTLTDQGWIVNSRPDLPPGVKGYSVVTGNGIDYHGGLIMPYTVKVNLIFYGEFENKTEDLIKDFVRGIGKTGYQNISTTYGEPAKNVTGEVELVHAVQIGYDFGKDLSDANIEQIVRQEIDNGSLPDSRYTVFFVITDGHVLEHNNAGTARYCKDYCGWHNSKKINGLDVKYAFVGTPEACAEPLNCEVQSKGPNDSSADGIVNIMAHELNESITDPDLNAWWQTSTGEEMADLCAWRFGKLRGGSIGDAGYNESFGGKNWLLQMLWEDSRGGGCDNYKGGKFH